MNETRLLSPAEVSNQIGVSEVTLNRWRSEKANLPYYRVGKNFKYAQSDVEQFLKQSKTDVT